MKSTNSLCSLFTRMLSIVIILVSQLWNSAYSSIIVSEIYVDTKTKEIHYVELTNISNKSVPVNTLEFSNGNESIFVNKFVTFLPNDIKVVIFHDYTLSDSISIDSIQLIHTKNILKIGDKLLMTIDNSDIIDTFLIRENHKGSIERNKVLVNEEYSLISSEFRNALPSPLKWNVNVRMKKIVAYSYDNSGNRIKSTGKNLVIKNDNLENTPDQYIVPDIEIEDLESHPEFKVYPNPTKGDVIVELPEIGNYILKIFNLNSVDFFAKEVVQENKIAINMNDLKTGIYLITVYKDSDILGTIKIIKK